PQRRGRQQLGAYSRVSRVAGERTGDRQCASTCTHGHLPLVRAQDTRTQCALPHRAALYWWFRTVRSRPPPPHAVTVARSAFGTMACRLVLPGPPHHTTTRTADISVLPACISLAGYGRWHHWRRGPYATLCSGLPNRYAPMQGYAG